MCSAEIMKLTILEIGWTPAPANACSLTYAWHFSDRFLWGQEVITISKQLVMSLWEIVLSNLALFVGELDSAFCWMDRHTAYNPYQNELSNAWYWFTRLLALSIFSNSLSLVIFGLIFPCKLSDNLCIWHLTWRDIVHWLAERHNTSSIHWWKSYFKYGRSKGSVSEKREREWL